MQSLSKREIIFLIFRLMPIRSFLLIIEYYSIIYLMKLNSFTKISVTEKYLDEKHRSYFFNVYFLIYLGFAINNTNIADGGGNWEQISQSISMKAREDGFVSETRDMYIFLLLYSSEGSYKYHDLASTYFRFGDIKKSKIVYGYLLKFLKANSLKNTLLDIENNQIFSSTYVNQIGHLAILSIYIKAKMTGLSQRNLILVHKDSEVINLFLYDKLKPFVTRIKREDFEIDTIFKNYEDPWLFTYFRNNFEYSAKSWNNVLNEYNKQNLGPLIQLTEKEISAGYESMKKLGFKHKFFVAIHIRDSSDSSTRNNSNFNWEKIIDKIVESGGFPVFLTHSKNTALAEKYSQYFEYSRCMKNDFLDIFLISQCKFYIGGNSGPAAVAQLFDKPIILIDCGSINNIMNSKNLFIIPKIYYTFRGSKKFISLKKMINSSIGDSEILNKCVSQEILKPKYAIECVLYLASDTDTKNNLEHSFLMYETRHGTNFRIPKSLVNDYLG